MLSNNLINILDYYEAIDYCLIKMLNNLHNENIHFLSNWTLWSFRQIAVLQDNVLENRQTLQEFNNYFINDIEDYLLHNNKSWQNFIDDYQQRGLNIFKYLNQTNIYYEYYIININNKRKLLCINNCI
jgi:hypothetical protein